VPDHLLRFITQHLHWYQGRLNLECIGSVIIELHWRWCPEWAHWYDRHSFYSVPLWLTDTAQTGPEAGSFADHEVVCLPADLVSPRRWGMVLTEDLEAVLSDSRYRTYVA
jgi:hypothetical protein